MALGGTGLGAMTHAENAHAAPRSTTWNFQVSNGAWYLHPGSPTDTPTFSSPVSDLMQPGTTFSVQCIASGDAITPDGTLAAGGAGDQAWEYGTDTATGNLGFASDQGLSTPTTPGQEFAQLAALGIPTCGWSPATSSGYDGQGAANWALAHAMDRQPIHGTDRTAWDEDCTFFAAQAVILGGGLQQTSPFNLTAQYSRLPAALGGATGTTATWKAPDFINYILATYPDSTYQELSFSQNDQPEARPGDIIAYDWDGDGTIDHLAVVVDDAPGTQYPEVAEWGNLGNIGWDQVLEGQTQATYQTRGWTWSALSNNWIQAGLPNAHAYLLHIVVPGF
jgi:putative amidase-like protein